MTQEKESKPVNTGTFTQSNPGGVFQAFMGAEEEKPVTKESKPAT